MGFKKEQKKKQIRKRNLIQDPDASMSSEFSYQDNQDGFSIEEEIDEKLQQQAQDFSDNDIEDIDLPEQDIESIGNDKEDILQNIDVKLKQSLKDLLTNIKNQPQILEKYQASYIISILFYFLKKNNFNEDIADHPVLNYISTFEENQQLLQKIKFQQKQKFQAKEEIQTEQIQDQVQEDDQPRLITKAMYRNRGVPKSSGYKKKVQNPRLRQKKKFEKAKEVMVSRGLMKKKKIGKHYQGETGGIKMGVDRTINIDQLNFKVSSLQ